MGARRRGSHARPSARVGRPSGGACARGAGVPARAVFGFRTQEGAASCGGACKPNRQGKQIARARARRGYQQQVLQAPARETRSQKRVGLHWGIGGERARRPRRVAAAWPGWRKLASRRWGGHWPGAGRREARGDVAKARWGQLARPARGRLPACRGRAARAHGRPGEGSRKRRLSSPAMLSAEGRAGLLLPPSGSVSGAAPIWHLPMPRSGCGLPVPRRPRARACRPHAGVAPARCRASSPSVPGRRRRGRSCWAVGTHARPRSRDWGARRVPGGQWRCGERGMRVPGAGMARARNDLATRVIADGWMRVLERTRGRPRLLDDPRTSGLHEPCRTGQIARPIRPLRASCARTCASCCSDRTRPRRCGVHGGQPCADSDSGGLEFEFVCLASTRVAHLRL